MKLTFCTLLFCASSFTHAQISSLRINLNIALPGDSTESNSLISALNAFLSAAQKSNVVNEHVYKSEKIETFIQLDELKGIEKSAKFQDDNFYKSYLSNVVLLNDNSYLLQISYIGVNQNIALLRASFKFVARRTGSSFSFSSPLIKNAKSWKVYKIGNNSFHYQNTINKAKVKEFNRLIISYDFKLNSGKVITDYYCCDNIVELQKLIGINYKSDYNGRTTGVWSSAFGDHKLIALGNNNSRFDHFDPHDLFHDRLSLMVDRSKVNKAVDEGCAYLYGGSWGFTWKEIFKAFKEQTASNANTNWLSIKEKPQFFKTGNFQNSADNIVNALFVREIESKKGFAGVWELLNAGPSAGDDTKYFQMLEKLAGITKANYNQSVWELINSEK